MPARAQHRLCTDEETEAWGAQPYSQGAWSASPGLAFSTRPPGCWAKRPGLRRRSGSSLVQMGGRLTWKPRPQSRHGPWPPRRCLAEGPVHSASRGVLGGRWPFLSYLPALREMSASIQEVGSVRPWPGLHSVLRSPHLQNKDKNRPSLAVVGTEGVTRAKHPGQAF